HHREARCALRSRGRALPDRGISRGGFRATLANEGKGVGQTYRVRAGSARRGSGRALSSYIHVHEISSPPRSSPMGKTSMLKRWIVAGLLTGLTFSAFADTETEAGQPSDPWQGMNRKVFAFNNAMDRWLLKPVAKGYAKVTPH